jgi:lipoprotein-anchoring transpeptidase ErfK/SrfK
MEKDSGPVLAQDMIPKKYRSPWQKATIGILIMAIVILGATAFLLWNSNKNLTSLHNQDQRLYTNLASSQTDYINSKDFVLPQDKKFTNTLADHQSRRESFIDIDLKNMKLSLYKDGVLFKTFDVLSKGRDGSWWETPTGNYTVLNKEQNHFSSIGKVWMPWSIQFYGNFFIHGWPYYENGTAVSSSFSGGCVRLNTADAKEIYQFTNPDMAILLREDDTPESSGSLISKKIDTPPPTISAEAFLVSDLATGQFLLEKSSDISVPIASLTKLMTGVVASELIYLERPISIKDDMLAAAFLVFEPNPGEQYIAFDLLYPLLMQSSNHAANILASYIGNDNFVTNMNQKAESLSMNDTTFADPGGQLSSNVSSAEDIDKLLRYIYSKRKFLLDISKGKQDYRFSGRKLDNLANFNEFADDDELVGMKNGETTAAKQTLAGIWEFESQDGEIPISIIVLGSTDREKDTRELLDWVKENFEVL